MFKRFFIVILLCYFHSLFATSKVNSHYFLSIADIHFDPFLACTETPCALILDLEKSPINEWPKLLKASSYTQKKQDTGYALLASALKDTQKTIQKYSPQFIVILGDFLAHDFQSKYKKFTRNTRQQDYEFFVKKTFAFLTAELQKTYPNISVYPVIGNNDSYTGDYASNINNRFYPDLASLFGVWIKAQDLSNFKKTFNQGGFYSVNLSSTLRLIVLNSVLFSKKTDAFASNAAEAQLQWLHQELILARKSHQKVFIAMHIPMGVDVYTSLRFYLLRLVQFWQKKYDDRFTQEMLAFHDVVRGILSAHLHADWFQIISKNNDENIPVSGTPAISPIFGNNPGYKIYEYQANSLKWLNFKTYYLDETKWTMEYDFNAIYQPHCQAMRCELIQGMKNLTQQGALAVYYKQFFAVNTNSQPIIEQWNPYYWCAIHDFSAERYEKCIVV